MAPDIAASGGGGGMSRAAKKRAKKKNKQQQQVKAVDNEHSLENTKKKKKKQQLFDDSDEEEEQLLVMKQSKKRKPKRDEDNSSEEEDLVKPLKKSSKKKTKKSSKKKKTKKEDHEDSSNDEHDVEMEMDGEMESDNDEKLDSSVAKGKSKDDNKEDDDEEDDDEDDIDKVVEEMVSMLSPSKILMLSNNNDNNTDVDDEHDSHILQMAKDQLSIDLLSDVIPEMTSKVRAKCLFNSLLAPSNITSDEFYQTYWEKQPLLIQSQQGKISSDNNSKADDDNVVTNRNLNGFLSLKSIQTLLQKEPMCYGRDLNVTRYEDTTGDGIKRRITLDLVDKDDESSPSYVLCDAKDVWSNYKDMGSTIRLLCPHKHVDSVHSLLSTLELEFGCMVGANAYLTPPSASQGFAPHYDDIEAFVLQLEGCKHWKVYPPMNKGETLPRASSTDYTEEDLKDIQPTLDVVLKPGDILYMPRGWIHQAMTLPTTANSKKDGHSLHLTVSAMQNWAWADLLEILVPEALEAACQSTTSTSLRQGLPRNFLEYMGAIHDNVSSNDELPEGLKQAAQAHEKQSNEDDEDDEEKIAKQIKQKQQKQFREEAKKRIMRVCKEAMSMIDAGCDQIGKRFLSDRLPPALFTKNELSLTSESKDATHHTATHGGKLWPNTLCRLVRPGIARLALEDNKAVLYHCVDNSRVYHGNPLSPMEFELDDAPALEMLLTTVEPHWICVQDLIHDDIEDKMDIAQSLYDEGILAILQTETPDKSVQTG